MTVVSFDARTGAPISSAEPTTREAFDLIVRTASEASELFLRTSPAQRKGWLYALAEALESHADELVRIADAETGLGEGKVRAELLRTAQQTRFYGDVAVEGSYLGVAIDDGPPSLVRLHRPVGPVAVFGASNFPFVLGAVGHDTSVAIAAGCPVVAKAHSAHVGLSTLLRGITTTALERAGAPEGAFGMVFGRSQGQDLVRAPEIAAVGFTGSESGGIALWRLANERPVPIPVYAEMGTVNPVVVTPAGCADLESIAAGFVACYTNNAGQYCTKPGLFFAPAGSGAAAHVAVALRAASPAPVMLTEGIANSVREGLAELKTAGARTVVELPDNGVGWAAPAALLEVEIGELVPGSRLLEECFGAVALVAEYASLTELHNALARIQPALAAAVWSSNGPDDDVPAIVEILSGKVGRLVNNGWTTGAMHSWAQHHGGPWPATSNQMTTSIGGAALARFVRPIAFQDVRDDWLPVAARRSNPWSVTRRVNGVLEVPTRSGS